MKLLRTFLISTVLILVHACNNKQEVIAETKTISTDLVTIGCLATYELLPNSNTDTINKMYGQERIKHGHWIIYDSAIPDKKTGQSKLARVKTVEGNYRNNKKEGLWKFYSADGSITDSVQYHNDTVIAKQSPSSDFKLPLLIQLPTCLPGRKCS